MLPYGVLSFTTGGAVAILSKKTQSRHIICISHCFSKDIIPKIMTTPNFVINIIFDVICPLKHRMSEDQQQKDSVVQADSLTQKEGHYMRDKKLKCQSESRTRTNFCINLIKWHIT